MNHTHHTVAGVTYTAETDGEVIRALIWDGYSSIPGAFIDDDSYRVLCRRCRIQIELPPAIHPVLPGKRAQIIVVRIKTSSLQFSHDGLWVRSGVRSGFKSLHRCGKWLTPLTAKQLASARRTLQNIPVILDWQGDNHGKDT